MFQLSHSSLVYCKQDWNETVGTQTMAGLPSHSLQCYSAGCGWGDWGLGTRLMRNCAQLSHPHTLTHTPSPTHPYPHTLTHTPLPTHSHPYTHHTPSRTFNHSETATMKEVLADVHKLLVFLQHLLPASKCLQEQKVVTIATRRHFGTHLCMYWKPKSNEAI